MAWNSLPKNKKLDIVLVGSKYKRDIGLIEKLMVPKSLELVNLKDQDLKDYQQFRNNLNGFESLQQPGHYRNPNRPANMEVAIDDLRLAI